MEASNFDRVTRVFSRGVSRRTLVALAGALVGARGRDAEGAQLAPASCGDAGAVCTMLIGCCDGLTCVTSTINVNYGVCAPGGDGGTVAATTSLISPHSEGIVEEVSSATADTATDTTATDVQAEQDAEIAERKARKDAHQNKVQLRRTEQRNRREDNNDEKQDKRDLARGPKLDFRLDIDGDPESLRVTNRDNETVELNNIYSLLNQAEEGPFGTAFALTEGESFLFISGEISDIEGNKRGWIERRVCDTDGDGFVVAASFSANAENFEFEIRCDGPSLVNFGGGNGKNQKRKKKKDNRSKSRQKKSKGRRKKKRNNG